MDNLSRNTQLETGLQRLEGGFSDLERSCIQTKVGGMGRCSRFAIQGQRVETFPFPTPATPKISGPLRFLKNWPRAQICIRIVTWVLTQIQMFFSPRCKTWAGLLEHCNIICLQIEECCSTLSPRIPPCLYHSSQKELFSPWAGGCGRKAQQNPKRLAFRMVCTVFKCDQCNFEWKDRQWLGVHVEVEQRLSGALAARPDHCSLSLCRQGHFAPSANQWCT